MGKANLANQQTRDDDNALLKMLVVELNGNNPFSEMWSLGGLGKKWGNVNNCKAHHFVFTEIYNTGIATYLNAIFSRVVVLQEMILNGQKQNPAVIAASPHHPWLIKFRRFLTSFLMKHSSPDYAYIPYLKSLKSINYVHSVIWVFTNYISLWLQALPTLCSPWSQLRSLSLWARRR